MAARTVAQPHRRRREERPGRLSRLVLLLTAIVAVLAVGPIAWGIVADSHTASRAKTALAAAPPGSYAIVTRTEGGVDIVAAVRADQPSNPVEIARVPHLEGFRTTGAVDPTGRYAALVTVDAGSPVQPQASLVVVDLQDGRSVRLLTGIEPLQVPLWTTGADAVIVTRSGESGDRLPALDVLEVRLDGEVRVRWSQAALAVAPVGWRSGQLLAVAIDGRGSTLQADGQDLLHLSDGITRDWALAPDGSAIAFIEASTDGGLRYQPRVAWLDGRAAAAAFVQAQAGAEALGAAWGPGGTPSFGAVPSGSATDGGVSAQALAAGEGFDIPLAYSPDGSTLAAVHWDGTGFSSPGRPSLQLIGSRGRVTVTGFEGFFGWVQR